MALFFLRVQVGGSVARKAGVDKPRRWTRGTCRKGGTGAARLHPDEHASF